MIADDQPLLRSGFKALISADPDFEVAGEAADGREAVRLARAARADVVLMDIRMPVLDGLAATRQIAADPELAAVKVLILTTFEIDEYVFEALRSGASGFLGEGRGSRSCSPPSAPSAGGRAALPRRHPGADLASSWLRREPGRRRRRKRCEACPR